MEILIISFDADPPHMGGVSTVTNILYQEFIRKGYNCTLGYIYKSDMPSKIFSEKINISYENINSILEYSKKKKFDIIITQFLFVNYDLLNILKKDTGKIISVYHSKPALRYVPFSNHLNNLLYGKTYKNKIYSLIHIIFFPIFKRIERKNDLKMYRNAYDKSNEFVLLSKQFYSSLKKIIPYINSNKLHYIGNPVVFNETLSYNELINKKKEVIIVCNYNHVKRIDVMFKIWKEIEDDNNFNEWNLKFVGGGENFERVISLAKKINLKRISFEGFTSPLPFYKESSITLMTSKYEGYPMVLLEALQLGVVPIVYNSFESLTDIIENGYNGIIVPNNKKKKFIENLKYIMRDDDKRLELSYNAIKSSKVHSKNNFIQKYIDLF